MVKIKSVLQIDFNIIKCKIGFTLKKSEIKYYF